jgi:hypothetical protein
VVSRAAVNGEFFTTVVEKIAGECDHAGRNRVARPEYDNGGGISLCD